jgi:hypothetical protein
MSVSQWTSADVPTEGFRTRGSSMDLANPSMEYEGRRNECLMEVR